MSIADFIQKPWWQLVTFIVLTLLVLLALRTRSAETLWTTAGAIYVLFLLTNSVLIWKADHTWTYFFVSVGLSILYILLISGITSAYEAMIDLQGSGESGMIFLVVIYHPVALLAVITIKWLVQRFF